MLTEYVGDTGLISPVSLTFKNVATRNVKSITYTAHTLLLLDCTVFQELLSSYLTSLYSLLGVLASGSPGVLQRTRHLRTNARRQRMRGWLCQETLLRTPLSHHIQITAWVSPHCVQLKLCSNVTSPGTHFLITLSKPRASFSMPWSCFPFFTWHEIAGLTPVGCECLHGLFPSLSGSQLLGKCLALGKWAHDRYLLDKD